MKAELKFDLPDDNDHYRCAIKATALRLALQEVSDYLRAHSKYTDPKKLPDIDTIRREFYEIIEEHDLTSLVS